MRPSLKTTLARLPAPLVLMALIFYLSAQPDLSSGLGFWDLILRKLAHMAEYGLLALLWLWALLPARPWRPALAIAAGVSLAYAASDEWHQSFVAGRHGTPVDVGIDLVGIAAAAAYAWRRRRGPSRPRAAKASDSIA